MTTPPSGPMPPCHQYRDFLAAEEHAALLEWTIAKRERFAPARLTGNVLDPNRRIAERRSGLGPHRTLFERRLQERTADIFRRTGTRPFGIEFIELEVAAHGDGAFFAAHGDIPVGPGRQSVGGNSSGTQDRLVSAVYYFHREPKRFTGGTLRLYRFGDVTASGDFVEFEPEQNSLVVFPSWAFHEVRRISCPGCAFEDWRFAVNAWLCRTLPKAPPPRP